MLCFKKLFTNSAALQSKFLNNSESLSRSFGLISEYNDRASKKFQGSHLCPEVPKFFTTPSRPGNFGEHLDMKVNIDNWFDENRL